MTTLTPGDWIETLVLGPGIVKHSDKYVTEVFFPRAHFTQSMITSHALQLRSPIDIRREATNER